MQDPGEVASESQMVLFLHHLVTEGRAVVSPHPAVELSDQALRMLSDLEACSRAELSCDPPEFSLEASAWTATMLYQVCRFIACRELGEEEVRRVLAEPCPVPKSSGTHWSVDLLFRHLPDLFQLARHLSHADPLLEEVKRLAIDWPLSSVGIPELTGLEIDSFFTHPALARLYADRVLAAGDLGRLGDPRLETLLKADLGAHRDLAPSFYSKLLPELAVASNL